MGGRCPLLPAGSRALLLGVGVGANGGPGRRYPFPYILFFPPRPACCLAHLLSMATLGLTLPRPPPAATPHLPISYGDCGRGSRPDGDPPPSAPLLPSDSKRLSHPQRRPVAAPFFYGAQRSWHLHRCWLLASPPSSTPPKGAAFPEGMAGAACFVGLVALLSTVPQELLTVITKDSRFVFHCFNSHFGYNRCWCGLGLRSMEKALPSPC
jgi:hypothetical protein